MSLDLIPMLLLSLLLITTGDGAATSVALHLDRAQQVGTGSGALIVSGGRVTVPASSEVAGPIHVLGGEVRIEGTVTGSVTQLGGDLVVEDGARIGGVLQHIGGSLAVGPEASIARRSQVEVPEQGHPVQRAVSFALLIGLLAWAGARRARRRPRMLANVADAAGSHPMISVTVGALVALTGLSVLVFMAFTLVLLPVSVLGLLAGAVAIAYGMLALGYRTGRHLPVERVDAATALGVAAVAVVLGGLGAVPVVGDLLVIIVALTGLGAVVITYFGLQRFTPAFTSG